MIDEKRIAEIDARVKAHDTARALRKTTELRSISPHRRAFLRTAADLIDSLQAQLAESQRREHAAIEDITHCCDTCLHDILKNNCYAVIENGDCVNWMWRGPQLGEGVSQWK